MTTLVLIPVRPDLHPALRQQAETLARALQGETDLVLDARPWHPDAQAYGDWGRRIESSAALRQAVLDDALRPHHRAVLWVDADIIHYPADLLLRLEALARPEGAETGEAITAPAVLLNKHHRRFYDIGGFIEEGRFARMQEPWFDQAGPVVRLDSVGCVYRVPADVYRAGAQHVRVGGFSDHYSVCAFARGAGRGVRADLSLEAVHAWLPDFGERAH
jgi:hypothetical protein